MSNRNAFIAVGGALGCVVLLLCIGVAAFAGFSYSTAAIAVRTVDRIAYVDNGMNIQITDPQGQHRVALTTDASDAAQKVYLFPTWSPDSQQIAFVGVSGDRDRREGVIHIAPVAGGNVKTVFKSESQFPFYLYWAPDSRRIGFLAQAENEMALMLGQTDGQGDARKLESGAPMYWAWSPDAQTMLLHVGGSSRDSGNARLALLRWQDGKTPQKFSDQPGAFQAPQFAPDGSAILYASSTSTDEDELFVANPQGTNAKSLLTFAGTIAFAWSPDSKRIASMVTPDDAELPMQGPIWVSDADGKNRKQITTEDALAFYWSPDSKQIAYLTIVMPGQSSGRSNNLPGLNIPQHQAETIHLRWNVVSSDGGKARTLATFVPTDNFISVLPFFDQYARSLTFWSPDSKHFVYTQSENDVDGGVWVADLDGGAAPHRVGDGTLAVWSWK